MGFLALPAAALASLVPYVAGRDLAAALGADDGALAAAGCAALVLYWVGVFAAAVLAPDHIELVCALALALLVACFAYHVSFEASQLVPWEYTPPAP